MAVIVLGAGHDLAELPDRCRKVQIATSVVDSFGKLLASLGLSSTSRSRCEHRLAPFLQGYASAGPSGKVFRFQFL